VPTGQTTKPRQASKTAKADFFAYDNIDWYRRLLLRLRYSLDFQSYDAFAKIVAGILNNELQLPAVEVPGDGEAAKADVAAIRRDGYTPVGTLLDPAAVGEVRAYLARQQVHDGWERVPGEFPIEAVPERVHVAHFDNKVLAACPQLIYLASHPRVIARMTQFLGTTPTIHYFALWWSLAGRPHPEDAQLYHIDRHCYRFAKLFVYLTDVDMESGPHCFVRGSNDVNVIQTKLKKIAETDPASLKRFQAMLQAQRKDDRDVEDFFGADNVTYITGGAGDCFLINTGGYHKGYLPKSRNRLVFQALYTMLPTIKDPVAPIAVPGFLENYRRLYGNVFSDDHLMYMNRLVVNP
jgi:hypothetical protein